MDQSAESAGLPAALGLQRGEEAEVRTLAEIRATLCDIIASFGDPEAIPRLTPLINDPSQTVADKANRAVERLRRSGAAKASR